MNIALIGYGKMGRAIEHVCISRNHKVVLKISSQNLHDLTTTNLQQADIAIEFTNPNSATGNILKCLEANIPVICGTTGWFDNLEKIKKVCTEKKGALLYATNFSIGVNIFFEINKKLAALMSKQADYMVSIEETHHTQKKDSPSGTAITIAEQILAELPYKEKWVNEKSDNYADLMITSKRIDPAPGSHLVKYTSETDSIEIIHTANNRNGFATGAVLAAEFIEGKMGIFGMKEVLGI